MTNKEYAITNVDVLIDFLWNDVPSGILKDAINKMIDEGLLVVVPKLTVEYETKKMKRGNKHDV